MNKRQRSDYIFFLGLLIINVLSLALLSVFVYRFFFLEEVAAFGEKSRAGLIKESRMAIDDADLQIQTMLEIPGLYFSESDYSRVLLKAQTSNVISSPSDVNDICSMLLRIQKTYPYLESMDVYYEGSRIAVTDFAHIHEIMSDEEIGKYIPWYADAAGMEERSRFIPVGINHYLCSKPVLSYIYRVRNKAWNGSIYIALHFSAQILDLTRTGFDMSSCIFSSDGQMLFERNMEKWQMDAAGRLGPDDGESSAGAWMAYQKHSDSTGLRYCVFTSPAVDFGLSADSARIQRNFIVIIVSCMLVIMMLTTLSYYIYRKYINTFSDGVGLSAKGSLTTTLTSMADMIETLDNQSRSFKDQTALRAFLLNRADKESYESFYNSADESYIVSVVLESSKDIPQDEIRKLCDSMEGDGRVMFTVFSSPFRIILVFLLLSPSFDRSRLEIIRSTFPGIMIDVGSVCLLRANGFQNSYASAMDVYNYRFMDGSNPELFSDELSLEEKRPFGNHIGLLSDIENFIVLEQKDTAVSLAGKLMDDLMNGQYTVQYVKATLGDLVSSVYSIIVQNHLDMWSLFGYDIRYYSAKRIRTVDEYRKWLMSAVAAVAAALQQMHAEKTEELPARIARIVEENLENDISLGMLADELGMREDALSRAFPSLMGCNYIDYVTERKLRKAVSLLYEGMPVQEISAYLGYRSPQYFIRIFKNAYGMTPHKFRNSRKKEEKDEDNINNV